MSSIMKGIVDESEEVAVIYIDGKPSAKYAKKHEAERDAEFMRKRHPNKKIEIKHEVRETEAKKGADGKRCWKGKRYAGTENGKDKCIPVKNEAANPAQQAAIAVNMKKHHKKPKHIEEASGTPGGVEMFRTKDMVNTTMHQNLYKRELQAVKDAEKKAKRAAYRAANPREAVPMMHIGASSYQIPAIQAWKDNGDVGEAIKYAVNKFANKQSKEFKADLASDPNFKEAVINFFNVGADILAARNAAMAKRGGSVPDSDYRTKEQTEAGYNAINIINDVLLNHMKKHGVDKTGRRVPPGFNYTLGEGVIVGHDANDPEIAILGGAGTMSLSRLKKKAHAEALQLADDIANGKYNASSYNMKQLHNTLNTIVAAEKEMEKLYFGEDYTGEFAAEKTPAINPYGGLKDKQHRGAISETPTDNPTGASGEGGWRKYKPKSAGKIGEAKKSEFRLKAEQQQLKQLAKINNSTLPHWAKEYLTLLTDPKGKVFKAAYYSFGKGQDARKEAAEYIMQKYKIPQEWIDKINLLKGSHVTKNREEDRHFNWDMPSMHEDTAYAGGMGQGGNAGESYRKFKPKSAGTFKESAIMKAFKRESK